MASDFRLKTQQRLLEAMESVEDPETRELIFSTQHLSEAVIERFLPKVDAAIYSRAEMLKLLRAFTDELTEQQAEWLSRCRKKNES